ncbi:MAG: glycosyltransferase family 87 protein [Gemmatimonadota bacterium]
MDDFRIYYQAGKRFLAGGWTDVYRPTELTPFKYHPLFAILFAPLALLPWMLAKFAWAALNGFWIWDAGRRFRTVFELEDRYLFLGLLFVIPALAWQLKLGNVTLLLLWLMAVVVSTGSPVLSGGAAGIMVLLKPFWAPVVLLPPLTSRRRTMLALLAAALGLSLLPLALGGAGTYVDWWSTLTDPVHAHNLPKEDNQTLFGLVSRNRETLGVWALPIWFVGSSLSGLLWIATVRSFASDRFERGVLAMVPFILWAAPLSWIHHQLWLWPVLALLLPGSSRSLLLVVWLLLTGTGELFFSKQVAKSLHYWGLPALAFPLIQILLLKQARAETVEQRSAGIPG